MPSKRSITASLALINTAERVVVAASGVGKAETVRAALEDEECELPGAMVDAFSTIWFLDAGAASKLQAYADADSADEEWIRRAVGRRRWERSGRARERARVPRRA